MSNITKQGLVNSGKLFEIPINPYDKIIYTEPDGSAWIRIIHHNNPTGAKFVSTDTFDSYVYKDADRWFFASLCNRNVNNMWEFMVKQKQTSSSTEEKYRWIQYDNPFTATYNTVKRASVTNNTSSGYNTSSVSGGMYRLNSNTYFVICNASNGNWFGALGCWGAYNGGIPGFPNTTVTSGYIDLYYRVGDTASIFNNAIQGRELIEW